ncbi:ADM_collapsed_G0020360.mRNA.1.CDS.1 [Saccharomyces cerevisiae]|nr:ADM_collapsed_G0020360.mRNA.1.CDS.1 [Saccharomyces cerevisiae]
MSRQDENSALLANNENNKPSYTGNENGVYDNFKLSKSQLSDLHNPKSIRSFVRLFGYESNSLFKYLKTDKNAGISLPEISNYRKTNRYKNYGDNSLPERIPNMILKEIKLSKLTGLKGVAIMIAVFVVVLVSAANDYQKELQFAKLNKKKENRKIIVIRNDQEILISIHHVLVGDVISLQTGDVVPADCVMISGKCEADESSITGESNTIQKFPVDNSLRDFKKFNSIDSHNHSKPLDIGDVNEDGNKIADCMLISGSRILLAWAGVSSRPWV